MPGPLEAVEGALDVGEERVAAPPGEQPDRAGLDGRAMPSKLTGRDVVSTWPTGPGSRAWAPVAYQAIPVCAPLSSLENVKVNATSACMSPSLSMLIR